MPTSVCDRVFKCDAHQSTGSGPKGDPGRVSFFGGHSSGHGHCETETSSPRRAGSLSETETCAKIAAWQNRERAGDHPKAVVNRRWSGCRKIITASTWRLPKEPAFPWATTWPCSWPARTACPSRVTSTDHARIRCLWRSDLTLGRNWPRQRETPHSFAQGLRGVLDQTFPRLHSRGLSIGATMTITRDSGAS